MKTYGTYQAKNAVKAAQVTNHIKAAKKVGVAHAKAKAEAYRMYNIKKGVPILAKHFSGGASWERRATTKVAVAIGIILWYLTTTLAQTLTLSRRRGHSQTTMKRERRGPTLKNSETPWWKGVAGDFSHRPPSIIVCLLYTTRIVGTESAPRPAEKVNKNGA